MEALIEGNKFAKGQYVVSAMHRVYKVLNVPGTCLMDDRKPGYLLGLVGVPGDEFKIEKNDAENRLSHFLQSRDDYVPPENPRFSIDQHILHVPSGGVYQVTDLPSDCVLEHNREPAYGYKMPDGRRCFRSQKEVEDIRRFTPVDKTTAALLALTQDSVLA